MAEAFPSPDTSSVHHENSKQFSKAAQNMVKNAIKACEDNEGALGMDKYLNALLFAEELVEYVIEKVGYLWPSEKYGRARKLPKRKVDKRFSVAVGDAIVDLIAYKIEYVVESYTRIINSDINDINTYRQELAITAMIYFQKGYSHRRFLTYAAIVIGIATFFIAKKDAKYADGSAQVLSYLLNYFIFMLQFHPYSDWFNLCLVAKQVRRELRNGIYKPE